MNNILSTIGLITGIIGALVVASNIGMFVQGYSLFLFSSSLWIIYGVRTKQINLVILNLVFGIINAIGIYNFY